MGVRKRVDCLVTGRAANEVSAHRLALLASDDVSQQIAQLELDVRLRQKTCASQFTARTLDDLRPKRYPAAITSNKAGTSMSMAHKLALGVGALCIASRLIAAEAFPSNEDLRHVRRLDDPRVSPSGARVLVHIAEATADGGRSHVWLIDVASNQARQLTYSPPSDQEGEHEARWLNDETIVFLAKRGERTELFQLSLTGGEAQAFAPAVLPPVDAAKEPDAIPPRKADAAEAPVGPLPLGVDNFEVAPDARYIAILARDPETPGEKKQREEKADAIRVDHDLHGKRLYLFDPKSGKLTVVAVPPDVSRVVWNSRGDALVALAEGMNSASDLGPASVAWLVKVDAPPSPHDSSKHHGPWPAQHSAKTARGCTFWRKRRRMLRPALPICMCSLLPTAR
jgi:hypothetical protein